jgi:hypothetical protein
MALRQLVEVHALQPVHLAQYREDAEELLVALGAGLV